MWGVGVTTHVWELVEVQQIERGSSFVQLLWKCERCDTYLEIRSSVIAMPEVDGCHEG